MATALAAGGDAGCCPPRWRRRELRRHGEHAPLSSSAAGAEVSGAGAGDLALRPPRTRLRRVREEGSPCRHGFESRHRTTSCAAPGTFFKVNQTISFLPQGCERGNRRRCACLVQCLAPSKCPHTLAVSITELVFLPPLQTPPGSTRPATGVPRTVRL